MAWSAPVNLATAPMEELLRAYAGAEDDAGTVRAFFTNFTQ
jgi:hypothetical protein